MEEFIFNLQRFDDNYDSGTEGKPLTIDVENDSNYGSYVIINGTDDGTYIGNYGSYVTINGGAGNENIYNETTKSGGSNVSINGGAGNDSIYNNGGSNVSIDGGAGSDYVKNSGSNVIIDGGADDDYIYNEGSTVTINAGSGADSIRNSNSNVTIDGGDGADTISGNGNNVSINGGAGNDSIRIYSGNNVTIDTSKGNDTISIDAISGEYGVKAFNVVGFGAGDAITFLDYDDDSPLTVSSLSFSDGSALVTLSNNAKVTIGVDFSGTKTSWTFDSTKGTAELVGKTGGGGGSVSVSADKYSVVYAPTSDGGDGGDETTTFATLTGIASTDGLSIGDDNVIVVPASALNGESVFLTNAEGYNYSLSLAEGVDTIDDDPNGWQSVEGGAAYKTGGQDSYYSLADDSMSISYTASVEASVQVELSGVNVDKLTAPSDGYVNLNAESFSEGKDITVTDNTGNYKFKLAEGDYEKHSFTGSTGNDSIHNYGSYVSINGGAGDDSIYNDEGGNNVSIDGGADNDTVYNKYNDNVSINGGAGNDNLTNDEGSSVSIDGGAGDDTITNTGSSVTIDGGAGDDYITNSANNVTINTSEGNDTVKISGATSFNVENFSSGDVITFGEKTVTSLASSKNSVLAVVDGATITIGGLSYGESISTAWSLSGTAAEYVSTTVTSGASIDGSGNIVYSDTNGSTSAALATLTNIKSLDGLSVADDSTVITISSDALDGKTVVLEGKDYKLATADDVDTKDDNLDAWTSDKGNAIYFTGGKDSYYSLSDDAKTLTFNDSVAGDTKLQLSGANVDKLTAPTKDVVTLTADSFSGNVSVMSNDGNYKFELAAGTYGKSFTGLSTADTITNAGSEITVNTGAGDDSIINSGSNVSINAGAGDDYISNSGSNVTIVAVSGNNTVSGFDATTKLQIGGDSATFSTEENGDDLIISYDGGTMTILDGKDNAENIIANISGTPVNNSYEIVYNDKKNETQSTSATLTSNFEGIFDATQYRSIETIKVDKNLTSDIEIIGNKRDNNITSSSGDDSIDGGKGADKIDGGAGDDTLAGGRGNDIITGGKGSDTFIYDGKGNDKITDYTAGEDTVNFSSGFKRASVSGSSVVFSVGRYGTLTLDRAEGKKITYTTADGDEVTEIFRKEGSYSEDEDALEIFSTFSGMYNASKYKNLETIDGGAVKGENLSIIGNTRDNSITGGLKDDSLDGGAGSDTLDGGRGDDSLFGGTGDDSLNGGAGNDTLRGGTGDDTLTGGTGKNVFVCESGDDVITDFSLGNNRIQLLSGSITTDYTLSGGNLIVDFTSGSLTIQNYDGNAVKFLDANGNESEYIFTSGALLNAAKTSATVSSSSYTADNKILRIDGSQVNSVNIVGNSRNNTILGSAGNDTLTGGDGNDFFVCNGGNDVITDYEKGDKIRLLNGTVTADNFALYRGNLILDFDSGSLTIQNYDGGAVKFVDANGKTANYSFTDDALMNGTKTSATLISGTSYTADSKLATIDATNLSGKISITGNSKANVIYGNNAGSSLIGGKGNDTLWGGDGADTFIFNSGDGQDVICNFNGGELDTIIRNGTDITSEIYETYNSSGKKSNFTVNFGGGDRLTFKNFK